MIEGNSCLSMAQTKIKGGNPLVMIMNLYDIVGREVISAFSDTIDSYLYSKPSFS